MDGVCEVLEKRKEYELNIVDQLDMNTISINNFAFHWNVVLQDIRDFLQGERTNRAIGEE